MVDEKKIIKRLNQLREENIKLYPHHYHLNMGINMAIAAIQKEAEQCWETEHTPPHGETVLLRCEVRTENGVAVVYTARGFFVEPHTEDSINGDLPYCWDNEGDWLEYDEEEDIYYVPSGYFERCENAQEYSATVIPDFVTGWMYLPSDEYD